MRNTKVPDGLRYHTVETFLEELNGCFPERTDGETRPSVPAIIFRPFLSGLASTSNKRLRELIQSDILDKIFAEQTEFVFDVDHKELAEEIRAVC